jgi:hypothetical protein
MLFLNTPILLNMALMSDEHVAGQWTFRNLTTTKTIIIIIIIPINVVPILQQLA